MTVKNHKSYHSKRSNTHWQSLHLTQASRHNELAYASKINVNCQANHLYLTWLFAQKSVSWQTTLLQTDVFFAMLHNPRICKTTLKRQKIIQPTAKRNLNSSVNNSSMWPIFTVGLRGAYRRPLYWYFQIAFSFEELCFYEYFIRLIPTAAFLFVSSNN